MQCIKRSLCRTRTLIMAHLHELLDAPRFRKTRSKNMDVEFPDFLWDNLHTFSDFCNFICMNIGIFVYGFSA